MAEVPCFLVVGGVPLLLWHPMLPCKPWSKYWDYKSMLPHPPPSLSFFSLFFFVCLFVLGSTGFKHSLSDVRWYLNVFVCLSLMIFFHKPVGHLCVFFWKISLQILCSFKKLSCLIFAAEVFQVLRYFGYMVCKYFLSFHRFFFHSVSYFLSYAEAF